MSAITASTAEPQQPQPLVTNKQFLKQLEKSWKPFPPWCVSTKRVPEDLNEELSLFSNLLDPTSVENNAIQKLRLAIEEALTTAQQSCGTPFKVVLSGVSHAGFGLVEGPLFFSAVTSPSSASAHQDDHQAIADILLETGLFEKPAVAQEDNNNNISNNNNNNTTKEGSTCSANSSKMSTNNNNTVTKPASSPVSVRSELGGSGGSCASSSSSSSFSIRLREAPSPNRIARSVVIFFGESAARSHRMGECLKTGFSGTNAKSSLAAWHVLMSSLKQTRNLDDNEPTALSSDAAATMMLSVANSYDAPPTCSQALTDFFLLYGFSTSFDMAVKSITIKGALVDVPKIHPTDAISVIDPLSDIDAESLTSARHQDTVVNLTRGMTAAAVSRLVNVFAYCYRVIAEYSRGMAEQERGRAESTLSTFLGGGPYWTRVIVLAEQGLEPYPAIVQHGVAAGGSGSNNAASGGRHNNNNTISSTNLHHRLGQHHYHQQPGGSHNTNINNNNNNNNNNYNNNRGGGGYFNHHQNQNQQHRVHNTSTRGGYYQQHRQPQQLILLPTPASQQQPPSYAFSINATQTGDVTATTTAQPEPQPPQQHQAGSTSSASANNTW